MPHHVATASSTDNPNLVPPLRLQTRKRPLSEKIDYSDMIAEETESGKRGRGKARAKSGGGTRGGGAGRGRGGGGAGGRVMDDVVCRNNNNWELGLGFGKPKL